MIRIDRITTAGEILDSQKLPLPVEVRNDVVRADIDGDGIRDLILIAGDGTALITVIYRGDNAWFRSSTKIEPLPKSFKLLSGDVTGNGLDDLVIVRAGSKGAELQLLVSNGSRFYSHGGLFNTGSSNSVSEFHLIEAGKKASGKVIQLETVAGSLSVSEYTYRGNGSWNANRRDVSRHKGELIKSSVIGSPGGGFNATALLKNDTGQFAVRLVLEGVKELKTQSDRLTDFDASESATFVLGHD
ncbi:MAG: hypothetical protein IPM63_04480 [Acidobacteriota bacterium]|nr:MAG: hypothetical protein IPM63_04480 [Acidobacteriota bacterium]